MGAIERPKGKIRDIKEGSDERKIMMYFVRKIAQDIIGNTNSILVSDMPLETREETIMDLMDKGIIRIVYDETLESFSFKLWDFESNSYMNI